MKKFVQSRLWFFAFICLLGSWITDLYGQYVMPDVMDTASIQSQLDYIEERTRIYNDFRAIREDIFRKMKANILDSLVQSRSEIEQMNRTLRERNQQITSLNSDLGTAREERDAAIRNRDSLSFFGIQLNKTLYNSIMWFIVLGLAVLAVLLFLLFKRTHTVTAQTRKELENTREEFEEYRKSSREKFEKLVVNHHNEIMKLKRS